MSPCTNPIQISIRFTAVFALKRQVLLKLIQADKVRLSITIDYLIMFPCLCMYAKATPINNLFHADYCFPVITSSASKKLLEYVLAGFNFQTTNT